MKRLLWLGLGIAALASGCQTTNMQMRARTGGAAVTGAAAESCQRMADRRADCEDQVGCSWNYGEGTCSASH